MVVTHLRIVPPNRVYVYIPSFLRKDFNITENSIADINKENGKIVITISNAGEDKWKPAQNVDSLVRIYYLRKTQINVKHA